MTCELHIFILWENVKSQREKILNDIKARFQVLEVNNIKWDDDNFSSNLTRFYGEKLPNKSHKELECGTGRFTLVVVLDQKPVYGIRKTSRGDESVNTEMFDAKALYREWTAGGHKVHATNNPDETRHDLLLLLGVTYDNYLKDKEFEIKLNHSVNEKSTDLNLIGCIQWESLAQMFLVLNENVEYLVLRNFEGMPEHYYLEGHGDIDLLVRNKHETAYLLNATPVFSNEFRVHYKININNQTVRLDLRYVGDDYYSIEWQERLLKERKISNGFYIPSDEGLKFSLLYHALIHKKFITDDYKKKLNEIGVSQLNQFECLDQYMISNGFKFVEPKDSSVYFNTSRIGGGWSIKRKIYWITMRVRDLWKKILRLNLVKKIKEKTKNALRKFV